MDENINDNYIDRSPKGMRLVFGIFMMSSGGFTLVRVRNELMAIREAEEEAAREETAEEVDGIAAARAMHSREEE